LFEYNRDDPQLSFLTAGATTQDATTDHHRIVGPQFDGGCPDLKVVGEPDRLGE
jgi:hypothetical protein